MTDVTTGQTENLVDRSVKMTVQVKRQGEAGDHYSTKSKLRGVEKEFPHGDNKG